MRGNHLYDGLQNGLLLGIPIVFDTNREDVNVGDKVLITYKGQNIGILHVESKYLPDKVGGWGHLLEFADGAAQ